MAWLPTGPDFVFAPRNASFRRLSRRNEYGRQGLVSDIAVDQGDPAIIYVVERPSSGGTGAFRSDDEGQSWKSIVDALQVAHPQVDPSCIAINPVDRSRIYLGTWSDGGVYSSTSRGDLWGPKQPIGHAIRKLLVDPRGAGTLATTVSYAATDNGVYRQVGGGPWKQVLTGDVWSLVASFPATGPAHFFAGVWERGVFHATDPTGPSSWKNLSTGGAMLPAHKAPTSSEPDGNFNAILVGICPRNPNRLYAWMTKRKCDSSGENCDEVTAVLYTTSAPLTAWSEVPMTSPPGPGYGFYNFAFAVCPNSPGDGVHDVLLFGSYSLARSTDGGATWTWPKPPEAYDQYHADYHSFAFFPEAPAGSTVPVTFIGCDGGLARSDKFADPAFDFRVAPKDFNEQAAVVDSGVCQNLNHGRQNAAVYQLASDPAAGALSYIGCQDTGTAAGGGSLGWRTLINGDSGAVAVATGPTGVTVWGINGAWGGWPSFRIYVFTDRGELVPSSVPATLGAGGSLLAGTSNYVTLLDGSCLAGTLVRDSGRTLVGAVAKPGTRTVAISAMTGVTAGSVLTVGTGDGEETVTVTATGADTITAQFANTHTAGEPVLVNRAIVVRIGTDGIATQASQDFGSNGRQVFIVAASPISPNLLFCVTGIPRAGTSPMDQRLMFTTSGAKASASTVWSEVTKDAPSGVDISSVALDRTGGGYALMREPLRFGPKEFPKTTPLWKVSGGRFDPQVCTGLPTGSLFGKLVADPVEAGTLYASHGVRVYRLHLTGTFWTWTDISVGLPGAPVYDLWAGNVGTAETPKALLRAAMPTRGVFERDVTVGATDSPVVLYVRDNVLDQGWLPSSTVGPNPYRPSERVYPWHCVDIKVDAQQHAGSSAFFQSDPEGATLPLSHILFDMLKDNSTTLPASDQALVHVQVQNRSRTPAEHVRVWAIYCNAAAGVPALSASPSMGNAFAFWDQFSVTGEIVPNLPSDSPWRSLGPPKVLPGVSVTTPQVASWPLTIPTLPWGDPGHYCVVAFIHSAGSPIVETGTSVDAITPRNKQVGQKNLHITAALPAAPGGPGGPPGGGAAPPEGGLHETPRGFGAREYVEFHNPHSSPRLSRLVCDLRTLPPDIRVSLRLTSLETARPLEESLSGIAELRDLDPGEDPVSDGFAHVVFEAMPSALATVDDIIIPAFGYVGALLFIRNDGKLAEGAEFHFDVQQWIVLYPAEPEATYVLVGGSTYTVRVAGEGEPRVALSADSVSGKFNAESLQKMEEEAERFAYAPPWAKEIVAARRAEREGPPSEGAVLFEPITIETSLPAVEAERDDDPSFFVPAVDPGLIQPIVIDLEWARLTEPSRTRPSGPSLI
jgi:hypothetical protein